MPSTTRASRLALIRFQERMNPTGGDAWTHALDHGYADGDGSIVGEPYDLDMSELQDLIADCTRHGWTFVISGPQPLEPRRDAQHPVQPSREVAGLWATT